MKIRNKERLIEKMISVALITAGISGMVGGVCLGRSAVDEMPDTYTESAKYAVGTAITAIGTSGVCIGFANYPYADKRKNDNEQNENNDKTL